MKSSCDQPGRIPLLSLHSVSRGMQAQNPCLTKHSTYIPCSSMKPTPSRPEDRQALRSSSLTTDLGDGWQVPLDTAPGKSDQQLFRRHTWPFTEYILTTSTTCCEQHFRPEKAYLLEEPATASSPSAPSSRCITDRYVQLLGQTANVKTTLCIKINFPFSLYKSRSTKLLFYPIQ